MHKWPLHGLKNVGHAIYFSRLEIIRWQIGAVRQVTCCEIFVLPNTELRVESCFGRCVAASIVVVKDSALSVVLLYFFKDKQMLVYQNSELKSLSLFLVVTTVATYPFIPKQATICILEHPNCWLLFMFRFIVIRIYPRIITYVDSIDNVSSIRLYFWSIFLHQSTRAYFWWILRFYNVNDFLQL